MKLAARLIEKPWGQLRVPHLTAGHCSGSRIGEVCFDHPGGAEMPVLIKYLYTSERLSIQVHPDNDQARSKGHVTGKDEMWIVLHAEADATIGLGLKRDASEQELRQAISDGSIVQLVDWRPVARGDVIYNRAGTIHAAGAGLVLLEIQQSIDLTYRLFDYGRPRELHLAEGLSVARGCPHDASRDFNLADGQSRILSSGPYFGAAWCAGSVPPGLPIAADHVQLVVVEGEAQAAGMTVLAGECCLVHDLRQIALPPSAIAVIAWEVPEALARAA